MSAHRHQGGTKQRRRILIVDDHPMTRRGMAQLIGQQDDLEICGEAGDAVQAMTAISGLGPELVLADVSLPDKHGLEFIKDIKALHPEVLILVVSMHEESLFAERALHAGARGYLMKNEGGEKLIEAIRAVLEGKLYLSPSLSASVLNVFAGGRRRSEDTLIGSLTDREFEVFQLVGEGLTTREIGDRLRMGGKTVETHRLHIREKLDVKTAPELMKYAIRWASSRLP